MLQVNGEPGSTDFDFISALHGGYHRYGFIDHAYLYNLYFPPERFFDLLKTQIHELVLSYPVGQKTLAGWVGRIVGQSPEHIVVGNGASELIKIVSGHMASRLILPVPSFNEYANAAPPGAVVKFPLDSPSFTLDIERFAAEARRCNADVAVVVSPNNPTSLLVPKRDLIRLSVMLAEQDCMLLVDESFIDFADDPKQASLEQAIKQYPNLAILKSMSKAYGICGLRIGYLLTANTDFADKVRTGLHIWNVNGFAETFLKMAPDYAAEFEASCTRVRQDRDQLCRVISSIEGMTAYKPDANFMFCRLPDDALSGSDVARQLFAKHNIFIKPCDGKDMRDSDRYVRIASRTQVENTALVDALRDVLTANGNSSQ